jgi:hypothetical protein
MLQYRLNQSFAMSLFSMLLSSVAFGQTFTVNFSAPVGPPLSKDKIAVYQTPLYSQAIIQNASPFLTEAQVRDIRYEIGIGKSNALAYNQVGGSSTSPTYNFSSIDGLFNSWTSVHTFPLLAFTYDPLPLQPSGGVFQDVPTNLATWGSINSAYANHFLTADGRPGVWFEQWNEPDLPDGSGGKVFFNGSQTDYGNVYSNGASGVRSGDPDARVGGPAIAYDTSYLTSSGILNDPIDFVSIHAYANYSSQLSALRSNVTSKPNLPLLITEYNSYTTFGPTDPNSLHQAAAAFFNDVAGLITNTDNPKVYWAQWVDDDLGMLTSSLHRKAIYNAYKIYQTMLPADQVSVSPSTSGNVGAMAGADHDNAGVTLWNNNTSAVTVTVNLNSLPFSGGTAQLYYIDQNNASYNDGAPENLAVNQQWTFGGTSTSWTGTIQPQSVAFIKAFDSTGQSLLSYNSIGNFVRSYYWYFNRSGTSYSDFDPWTSIARVGMGSSTFDVAQIGNVYNNPSNNLTVTVTKSGPFSTNDSNSLFGLRFDFQNTSGNYDHSVLYTNGLYNSARTSTLPWGEGTAVPDQVITQNAMNTGAPFQITLSSIAPSDWNQSRVIITPIIQNAGAGSQARIVITPSGSSTAGLPYHDALASGSAPGWTTYNGTWSVSNSSYVNSAIDTGGDKAVTGSTSWGDYTLQGDVRITGGSGDAGLLTRVTNPTAGGDSLNGYYVGVNTSGNLVLGREAYGWTQLQTAAISGGVSLNTWYHVTVQAVGCTLTVSAQPVGSTTVTGFSYNDSGCSSTTGQVGVRSFNTSANWRDISVSAGGTTATLPYYAPFASSASGWSTYAGSWSLANEAYTNSAVDTQGDKSIGGPTGGNFTLTGDVQLTTSQGDAGFLLRATNPAVGTDSVDAYYLGLDSGGSLAIGKESYGWTPLATTPIAFSPNAWYHVTGEVVGCQVTLTAQPANSTTATSVSINDCSFSSGQVGVRTFSTSAAWRYVSVTPR